MPAYITKPQAQQVNALYKGNSIALVNNASTDSNVTNTLQCAIAPEPGVGGVTVMATNTTNQQATGQWAPSEVLAGGAGTETYEALSGFVVPAGSSLAYNLSGGWLRFNFGTAPTSGSLIVAR